MTDKPFAVILILCLSFLSIDIANASEEIIDYIDNAQTQAYGMHCAKTDNSWRSIEIAENTSSGSFIFNNFNSFIDITDKIVDEMQKDWLSVVSYVEGEIR